jgi:hypothetical protein
VSEHSTFHSIPSFRPSTTATGDLLHEDVAIREVKRWDYTTEDEIRRNASKSVCLTVSGEQVLVIER